MKPLGSKRLKRRTFLKATGISVALPFLEAMLPRNVFSAPLSANPQRFVTVYWSLGTHESNHNHWKNVALNPLKSSYGNKINIYNGINNMGYDSSHWHTIPVAQFLSGSLCRKEINDGFKSMDQFIAEKIKGQSTYESVHLCGSYRHPQNRASFGTPRNLNYANHISWKTNNTPNMPEINPARAYATYLAGAGNNTNNQENIIKQLKLQKSALDFILEKTKRLSRKVSSQDKEKLENYFSSFREIEQKLSKQLSDASSGQQNSCSPGSKPNQTNFTIHEQAQINLDIIYKMFECDLTRTATMMFNTGWHGEGPFVDDLNGRGAQYSSFGFRRGSLHAYSHQLSKVSEARRAFEKVAVENTRVLKNFVDKMANLNVGGKSALDNSIILYGSGTGAAFGHHNNAGSTNLPVLTIGGLNGRFKTNQHNYNASRRRITDLHLAIMAAYGANTQAFARGRHKALGNLS